jgi:hypothetical protein
MFTLSQSLTVDQAALQLRAESFRVSFPQVVAASGELRLASAVNLAAAGKVRSSGAAGVYIVQSESNPAGLYTVDTNSHSCTCPDHGHHSGAGVVCKHRLAVALASGWAEAEQVQAAAPVPVLNQRQLETRLACLLHDFSNLYDRILFGVEPKSEANKARILALHREIITVDEQIATLEAQS